MDGFRFFRDDKLLEFYQQFERCQLCEYEYFKDEIINDFLTGPVCQRCRLLIKRRIYALENDKRKSCPLIKSKNFIFNKRSNRGSSKFKR
jgi:hypothetical protein